MMLYKIGAFTDTTTFLLQIAEKRGKLKKRGVPDLDSAARTVLDDWNSGRIPYFTMPPAEDKSVHVGAAVVAEWGAAFDLQSVIAVHDAAVEGSEMGAGGDEEMVEMRSDGPQTNTGMFNADGSSAMDEGGSGVGGLAGGVGMHLGSKSKMGKKRIGSANAPRAGGKAAGGKAAMEEDDAYDFSDGKFAGNDDDESDGEVAMDQDGGGGGGDNFGFDDSDDDM